MRASFLRKLFRRSFATLILAGAPALAEAADQSHGIDASQYGIIAPTFSGTTQSYVRLFNGGAASSTFDVLLLGSWSGKVYGQTKINVASKSAPQFSLSQIVEQAKAPAPSNGDNGYVLYLKNADSAARYQHVIFDTETGYFNGATACQSSHRGNPSALINVHTSSEYMANYPSTVVIHNDADALAIYSILISDAKSGEKVGYIADYALGANGTNELSMERLEQLAGFRPAADQTHVNITLTNKTNRLAAPIVRHIVSSASGADKIDLSNLCALTEQGVSAKVFKSARPIEVERSSYENKMAVGEILGPQDIWPNIPSQSASISTAYAFADFFQDGSYSLLTTTQHSSANAKTPDLPSTIQFWRREQGKWIDRTALLLSDNVGCVHPRKALVADFNADRKPDVFLVCHGYGAEPWPGEQQRIILSQAGGSYRNTAVPYTAYAHGGAAVDFDNSGYADVVLTDTSVRGQPFYLKNNRDGTFSEIAGKLPVEISKDHNGYGLPIYSLEIADIDNDGKYDLWVGGSLDSYEVHHVIPTVYYNNGANAFVGGRKFAYRPLEIKLVALDVIFENQTVYTLHVENERSPYDGVRIEKTLRDGRVELIYRNRNVDETFSGAKWFPWITYFGGNLVAAESSAISIPLQSATP